MSCTAVAVAPAGQAVGVCPIHQQRLYLRRCGRGDYQSRRCRQCERDASWRYRQRKTAARRNARRALLTSRLLRSGAEHVSDLLWAMRRSWGNLDGLLADLPERDRAAVVLKLSLTHDELHRRAAEAESRENAALGDASRDQATIAAAAQVLRAAGWTVEPPV